MRVQTKTLGPLMTAILVAETALAVVQANKFKPGFNFFSRDTDIQEGRKAASEVDKQLPLVDDSAVLKYVNELGRRLATVAPNNFDYPWTFKVVNSSDINAFALPGGFIYVNRATIEAAENEAQLAGVIAHEEGHVVMRHATHRASEIALAKFPLAIVGGLSSSQLTQLGLSFGLSSILLHNSRGAEAQADQVGTYILYHAGYDPHAMAQFFDIIQKKYPQRTLEFFSDHPNPEHRIESVDAEIPELGPARDWKQDNPQFHAVKDRLLGMPPAPKPRVGGGAGASAPPAEPSSRMKSYQGQGFAIRYPANWQASGTQDNVVLAPKGAIWSDPQNGSVQAYGASISRSLSASNNLDADTRQLIESLRRSNPNMHVVQQRQIDIGGHPAIETLFENDSPLQGQKESDQLVTVESNGKLITVVFIAPQTAYDSYRRAFNAMLQSLAVG